VSDEKDDELSAAARGLRREWESPALWPRIADSLSAEARRAEQRRALFRPPAWLALAAVAAVVAIAVTVGLQLRSPAPAPEAERRLLTDKALRDVERAEGDYVRTIEDLSRIAESKAREPSPLMMSYREKLLVLDGAIADCRARIDRNRFNAHLRRELLSLYQEKQRTLQQLMNEDNDAL
jgi:ribosomal protein S10